MLVEREEALFVHNDHEIGHISWSKVRGCFVRVYMSPANQYNGPCFDYLPEWAAYAIAARNEMQCVKDI